jgi:catechol 2,3-dioxygenase-like lactoylglutathione lyase family enzyme
MITGAHLIVYSKDAEADRAFFRDVLGWPHADAGKGWLIFKAPPAELAVHPYEQNDRHEIYLVCDDIREFRLKMSHHSIPCSEIRDMGWGHLTELALPGGGRLGVYEPLHIRP